VGKTNRGLNVCVCLREKESFDFDKRGEREKTPRMVV
jgi:hypothetical protein